VAVSFGQPLTGADPPDPLDGATPTHKIVTILLFLLIFLASLTHATRLQALDEPRKIPSCVTRYRAMATASASVILYASSMISRPREKLWVI
jgi:hypothetical protein